jgi:hypothetical protein
MMRIAVICAVAFSILVGDAWAQTKTLTPLVSYDASGNNIVSYYRYVVLDCPDETACTYQSVIMTPGRAEQSHIVGVITG